MLDWSTCTAIERQPGKLGGVWLFKGTRVPVKALLENLEGGGNISDFLEWFPGVDSEQVATILTHIQQSLEIA
ncbi:MAG TPA: DUF433 domain-containing protein [Vineibacter sp.]|nr:DUF433 domain-containing protein [Vineibacter sp.]